MGNYTVYPLKLGTIQRDKSNMMYLRGQGESMRFPLLAWLVTDGENHILVDLGGSAPDGVRYQPYSRAEGEDLPSQLKRYNLAPDDIDAVILTHLHWDHAGALPLFTKARVFVQDEELRYAKDPLEIQRSSYDRDLILAHEYVELHGDEEIMDGVSVVLTPGHSPGSQSVIVRSKECGYVITGDLIGLYECFEQDPMIANGLHTDLVVYYRSLQRIKDLALPILPGHDPRVLEQTVYPPVRPEIKNEIKNERKSGVHMYQESQRLPCVVMRGGTSKAVFLLANDLPSDQAARDKVILSVFGSPDVRQINGLGGADTLTSKLVVIAPSSRSGADVDYTFGQVDILTPFVDYGSNCGNISSAVGPFCITQGLIRAVEPYTTVRIYNTNTDKIFPPKSRSKTAGP